MAPRALRARPDVNYSEKVVPVATTPSWLRKTSVYGMDEDEPQRHNENSKKSINVDLADGHGDYEGEAVKRGAAGRGPRGRGRGRSSVLGRESRLTPPEAARYKSRPDQSTPSTASPIPRAGHGLSKRTIVDVDSPLSDPRPRKQRSDAPSASLALARPPSPPPPEQPRASSQALLARFSDNFAALQAEYGRLQAEYEELKSSKIGEEVTSLLEGHAETVAEHGRRAKELVRHWQAEAARLERELEAARGQREPEPGDVEARLAACEALRAELAAAREEAAEARARVLAEQARADGLQVRCDFLRRFARVYESQDKCIQAGERRGTEDGEAEGRGDGRGGTRENEGVRGEGPLPGASAPPLEEEARALAPEAGLPSYAGALPGSAAYAAAGVSEPTYASWPAAPLHAPRPGMQDRALSARVESGGHSQAASAAGPDPQRRRWSLAPGASKDAAAAARRLSAPPAPPALVATNPLFSHAGQVDRQAERQAERQVERQVERQLRFSSLRAVAEEDEAEPGEAGPMKSSGPSSPPPSSQSSLPPRSRALAALTGLEATPLRRGAFRFAHAASGFAFTLGPAPDGGSSDAEDFGGGAVLVYVPVALGAAAARLPAHLREEISFAASQRPKLLRTIMAALGEEP